MKSNQLSAPLGLSNFPTEILLLIFGHFCLHCREPNETLQSYYPSKQQECDQPSWYSLDLQALYSTCLVSRRFRDVAQPILYHEFVPGYGDSYFSMRYRWAGRFMCFFRTVTLRRDLANLVNGFYLSHWLLDRNSIGDREIPAILEESARIRGINLSEFLQPFRRFRQSQTSYRPTYEELLTMLLSYLPNLARLYIAMHEPPLPIPAEALRAAGVQRMRLETIEIDARCSNLRDRLGDILDMSLSTLKTLNISSYCTHDGDKLGISGISFPSLRNISVTLSGMSESDLEVLLSCCTGLETFIYDSTSILYCIQPSRIIKHLIRHQETLTKLRLDLRDARISHERYIPELMCSLKIFPILSIVSLNLLFIYNSTNERLQDESALCQLLPYSIVSVQLYDTVGTPAGARLSHGLLGVVDAVSQGHFPSLKTIMCFCSRTAPRL